MNNKQKFVVEFCANCDTEVEMRWDVEKSGFRAHCPYCGALLMLCDECQHRGLRGDDENDCDWNHDGDKLCMMQMGLV